MNFLDGAAGDPSTRSRRAPDPAPGIPRVGRAAPTGRPGSAEGASAGPGGTTSPRSSRERAVAEKPDPVTGAAPDGRAAPGRGWAPQAPVTAEPDESRVSGPSAVTGPGVSAGGESPAGCAGGTGLPSAGSKARAAPGAPVSLADLQAAAMSEDELEEQIRDACKKLGIIRIHVYNSRGTTSGVPDDILIGPRGILWRECKTAKGRVTPAQLAMGEALQAAGQDWAIWRPADWLSQRIATELAALAGLRAGAA